MLKFVSWAHAGLVSLARAVQKENDHLTQNHDHMSQGDKIGEYLAVTLTVQGTIKHQIMAVRRLRARRHIKLLNLLVKAVAWREMVGVAEQPFRRVYELVEHLRANGNDVEEFHFDNTLIITNFAVKATAMLLRGLLVLLQDLINIRKEVNGKHVMKLDLDLSESIRECEQLINAASRAKLPRETIEGHIFVAQFLTMQMSLPVTDQPLELEQEALEHLDLATTHIATHPGSAVGLADEIDAARRYITGGTFYRTVTSVEMRAVYTAMSSEFLGTG